MELGMTLYVTNREEWRAWLAKNHDKEKEIWLIYYKKGSGKPRISYNNAVEEALCYGWIDSIMKRVDDERFAQRFSPRKINSELSQANRERIHKLINQKRMTPAGLEAVSHVYDIVEDRAEKFTIAPDILGPLQADKDAWKNFQNFPKSYQRIRIGYIESRRCHGPDMFDRSLRHFIKMTRANKRIGFIKEI
jgi:uncharacterized protein YdeI (YjbR/CyaY-like superfamily)